MKSLGGNEAAGRGRKIKMLKAVSYVQHFQLCQPCVTTVSSLHSMESCMQGITKAALMSIIIKYKCQSYAAGKEQALQQLADPGLPLRERLLHICSIVALKAAILHPDDRYRQAATQTLRTLDMHCPQVGLTIVVY